MMRKMAIIVVALALSFPASGLAGEYLLAEGNGVEVCEAYGTNLNSFALYSPMPLVCERRINPNLNDFRRPKWEEIDLWENRELLKKIELFLGEQGTYGDSEKWPHIWEQHLKWRMEHKLVGIMLTRVDIDNDGNHENVIRYIEGHCPETRTFGTPLLVLNDKRNAIEIDKSKQLFQNPKVVKTSISEGYDLAMYDVFIYKGKVYFDRWSQSYDQIGFLNVFVTESKENLKPVTKAICRYQYIATKPIK